MKKKNIVILAVGILTLLLVVAVGLLFLTKKSGGLCINEVCSKNEHIFADGNGNYYDYIELYNASKDAIDLTGYGLSDKEEEPFRYTFPSMKIKAGEYLVLLATKKETDVISTGFGFDADKDNVLFLCDAQRKILDSMEIPPLIMDTAYGRNADGGEEMNILTPSPNVSNQLSSTYVEVQKPTFSTPSGFYKDNLQLEITCEDENVSIYYTLDGSVPDRNSYLYQEPIVLENASGNPNVYSARTDICAESSYVPANPVNKANIIRAVAYREDGNHSTVQSGTYFVGLDQKQLYGNAPVISLITDPDNLFDYTNGIYVLGKTYDDWLAADPKNAQKPGWEINGNYNNKGDLWEKEVHFEYLMPDGSLGVAQDMGIRIKGNKTRTNYQKSFRLIARKKYGNSSLQFDLLPEHMRSDGQGNISEYKAFVLRSGGNDCERTKYRDVLIQSLVSDRGMENQHSIPCVVFLDGEYWGLYSLTEEYSDDYFASNYGIDAKNVIMLKKGELEEGVETDMDLFMEMYQFITSNDMSKPDHYAKAKEYLDMENFIPYCAFQIYIHAQDALNNWGMWRVRDAVESVPNADGKWRMYVYDTEYSADIFGKGEDCFDDNISNILTEKFDAERLRYEALLQSLCKNEEFRKAFINMLCDMRNYDFAKERVSELEQKIGDEYAPLAPESIYRNGPDWVVAWMDPAEYYEQKRQEVRDFFDNRYDCFIDIVSEALGTGENAVVSVTVSEEAAGTVQVNSTLLDLNRFEVHTFWGRYFKEYPIEITAIPNEGYRFVGWKVRNGVVQDEESNATELSIGDKCQVIAVFEQLK